MPLSLTYAGHLCMHLIIRQYGSALSNWLGWSHWAQQNFHNVLQLVASRLNARWKNMTLVTCAMVFDLHYGVKLVQMAKTFIFNERASSRYVQTSTPVTYMQYVWPTRLCINKCALIPLLEKLTTGSWTGKNRVILRYISRLFIFMSWTKWSRW